MPVRTRGSSEIGGRFWHTTGVSQTRMKQESEPATDAPHDADESPETEPDSREIGGRQGPDPTRYGDWEKAGRCIDF